MKRIFFVFLLIDFFKAAIYKEPSEDPRWKESCQIKWDNFPEMIDILKSKSINELFEKSYL